MKYLTTLPALCVALFVMHCMSAQADAGQAVGKLAGVRIDTRVDSLAAKHLIEHTPEGERLRAIHLPDFCPAVGPPPDAAAMTRLTTATTPDTATALLIDCLMLRPRVARAQRLFHANLNRWRIPQIAEVSALRARATNYRALVVPGWGYRSNAEATGSDLAGPRDVLATLGVDTDLVELVSNGSVDRNAQVLVGAILDALAGGKGVILVSASSGGPTVAMALQDERIRASDHLLGWLNVCGVLKGSRHVDDYSTWPRSLLLRSLSLLEGWRYRDLQSLSFAQRAHRQARFQPPPQLTVLNYIGVPFSGQVSAMGRHLYRRLKHRGPNDGLTFITDAMAPGYTILAIGSDHFINADPDIEAKTAALLSTMLTLIETGTGAQS